ncbi:MAG TPA: DUF2232 domain-containing protein [Thermoanaerobaculia bacterium]|nr:DUF2232 domain-containing protein [Thermoanaerobaculia bacterium]
MIESSVHPSEPVMLPGRPSGAVARSIAAHVLVTVLMLLASTLVFVPAALLHCGIRNGRRAAWITAALAIAPFFIYATLIPAGPAANNGWSHVAVLGLAIALPTLLVLPFVQRGEKFGSVLALLLVFSFLGLAATEMLSRAALDHSPYASQIAEYDRLKDVQLEQYKRQGMPEQWLRSMRQLFETSRMVLPAMLLTAHSFVFILSLLMLGRLNAWRELAARRGDDQTLGAYLFRNFSLPDWVLFAFIIGGLTPLATGVLQKVAANTLVVAVFLYMLQGLAIFRFLVAAMGGGLVQTLFGWLMLVFLTALTAGAPILLLGVAGLFDSFFDFRHFKKRKDDSHESHSD